MEISSITEVIERVQRSLQVIWEKVKTAFMSVKDVIERNFKLFKNINKVTKYYSIYKRTKKKRIRNKYKKKIDLLLNY